MIKEGFKIINKNIEDSIFVMPNKWENQANQMRTEEEIENEEIEKELSKKDKKEITEERDVINYEIKDLILIEKSHKNLLNKKENHIINELSIFLHNKFETALKLYNQMLTSLKQMHQDIDHEILRNKKIIGVTTTSKTNSFSFFFFDYY